MKVLHVNEHGSRMGGVERYIAEVAPAMAARGWDPVLVVSAATDVCTGDGQCRVMSLPPSFGLRSCHRAAAPLRRILDQERPDLVHLHNIHYFLGPSLLRLLQARTPVVQTVHDTRLICPRWLSKLIPSARAPCAYPLGRHCFQHGCYPFHRTSAGMLGNLRKFVLVAQGLARARSFDRLLVGSRYMREELLRNGCPPVRIETLPLFLPAGDIPPAAPRQRRIVFAGRVDETKGVRQFLASLVRLPAGDWTAQVAGDGPFLNEARALVARDRLQDKVTFLGRLTEAELKGVLASAQVLAMPSLVPESFGLIGLEAMACGTPVVAFDAGGISEWLKDGRTGFLVPWGDVEALSRRLFQLLTDNGLRDALGQEGREWVKQFDKSRYVDRLDAIYRDVVARRRGTGAR